VIAPPPHVQEEDRLNYLDSFELMDTLPEAEYDRITRIAAEVCGTSMSLITLISGNRQWFKSSYGTDSIETPRELSICGYTIVEQDPVFEVQDTHSDERFRDNPLVLGGPGIRFYAGVALKDQMNLPIGTLCVLDRRPNFLTSGQRESLMALGEQVMSLLSLRKKNLEWSRAVEQIEVEYTRIEEFAFTASHDIKSPVNNIVTLSEILQKKVHEKYQDTEHSRMLKLIKTSALKIRDLVEVLLNSRSVRTERRNFESFSLPRAIQDLKMLFSEEPNLELNLETELEFVYTHKVTFDQILLNLIANAVKYNQKERTVVDIEAVFDERYYTIRVTDNGPGIPREKQDEIFQLFHSREGDERLRFRGQGVGLHNVRKWVAKLGGEICLHSPVTPEGGSCFAFSIRREED